MSGEPINGRGPWHVSGLRITQPFDSARQRSTVPARYGATISPAKVLDSGGLLSDYCRKFV